MLHWSHSLSPTTPIANKVFPCWFILVVLIQTFAFAWQITHFIRLTSAKLDSDLDTDTRIKPTKIRVSV